MPRYMQIDTGLKFLPIDLFVPLLPGTFEHALSHLIDHELDLRVLDGVSRTMTPVRLALRQGESRAKTERPTQ